jgi:hypothetical protein
MKIPALFRELQLLAERLGYAVVQDTGNFNGGVCTVEGQAMIVLNRSAPVEQRLRYLAQALAGRDMADVYVKPIVRNLLEFYQEQD